MPETITAPAPSTTAAPATPAAPSTPAAPAAKESPFSALDTKARAVTPKEPAKEPDKKADAALDLDKTGDKPAPADKDKQVIPTPRELRQKFEEKSREYDRLNSEHGKLKEKLTEFERVNGEKSTLSERLAARDKEYEALQAEVATAHFERSQEFKDKFEKPFANAAEYAKQVVQGLRVNENDGQGNVTQRAATWDDFAFVYSLPPAKAEQVSQDLFGTSSAVVMRHFDKLRELDHNKREAIKEYESTAGERTKAQEAKAKADQIQRAEKINHAWSETNRELMAANPDLFGEKVGEGHEDDNALWKESLALVDQAYTGRQNLTPDQLMILDANIRLRAAAYPRLLRQLELTKAELAKLNAAQDQREASLPGDTKRPGAGGEKTEKDMFADLRESVTFTP